MRALIEGRVIFTIVDRNKANAKYYPRRGPDRCQHHCQPETGSAHMEIEEQNV